MAMTNSAPDYTLDDLEAMISQFEGMAGIGKDYQTFHSTLGDADYGPAPAAMSDAPTQDRRPVLNPGSSGVMLPPGLPRIAPDMVPPRLGGERMPSAPQGLASQYNQDDLFRPRNYDEVLRQGLVNPASPDYFNKFRQLSNGVEISPPPGAGMAGLSDGPRRDPLSAKSGDPSGSHTSEAVLPAHVLTLQDGDRTITPNQSPNLAPPGPSGAGLPAYDPTTPALPAEPRVSTTDAPGARAGAPPADTPGTRTGGSTGKPGGLEEDAVEAEKKLNFMQRFMRDKLGMEDPDQRHSLAMALIKGGAAMATTPGDFSEGLAAGTSAGADAYVGEEERGLENDRKRELMDLKREEAAAQRAGDAMEMAKKRLEIAKLEREAARDDGTEADSLWRVLADLKDKPAQRAFLTAAGYSPEEIDRLVGPADTRTPDPLAGLADG